MEGDMTDCLFCKLVNREIPTEIVFESDTVFAFKDIEPQAPHHVLIIPKKHIPTLNDLSAEDSGLVSELVLTATQIARELKIDESGYRTLFNCNDEGGQDIYHIHLHLLGGRQMAWPPG
jgi:histidine triad (HIT) family protein